MTEKRTQTLNEVMSIIQPSECIDLVKWHDDKISLHRSVDGKKCALTRLTNGYFKTLREFKYDDYFIGNKRDFS